MVYLWWCLESLWVVWFVIVCDWFGLIGRYYFFRGFLKWVSCLVIFMIFSVVLDWVGDLICD